MSFLLHTAEVSTGSPTHWLLAVHGIFGSGGNLRTFAARLTRERPDWGVVLADLRGHGRSLGPPPPHDLHAAARDLVETMAHLAGRGRQVTVLLGHSLGGKVALLARATTGATLAQTWILDATPSARPDAVDAPSSPGRVLRMLEELPATFATRADFVSAVLGRGHTETLAQWLAMNLEAIPGDGPGGYRLRIDLGIMRDLLEDYVRVDAWPALTDPSLPGSVHVVVATRSSVLSRDDRERLSAEVRAHPQRIARHDIDSDHWVHAEKPEVLAALVAGELGTTPGLAPSSGGHDA